MTVTKHQRQHQAVHSKRPPHLLAKAHLLDLGFDLRDQISGGGTFLDFEG